MQVPVDTKWIRYLFFINLISNTYFNIYLDFNVYQNCVITYSQVKSFLSSGFQVDVTTHEGNLKVIFFLNLKYSTRGSLSNFVPSATLPSLEVKYFLISQLFTLFWIFLLYLFITSCAMVAYFQSYLTNILIYLCWGWHLLKCFKAI